MKSIDEKFDLRFIDSLGFIEPSLPNLASNHPKRHIDNTDMMMVRKRVYPYAYFDSIEMKDTNLPPKEEFFSMLRNGHIKDPEYKHTQEVWQNFGCKTVADYHKSYLRTDVLILAYVFQNFRKVCMNKHKLDPAWYFTSPGFAWDAALKETGITVDLLTDPEVLLILEKGI